MQLWCLPLFFIYLLYNSESMALFAIAMQNASDKQQKNNMHKRYYYWASGIQHCMPSSVVTVVVVVLLLMMFHDVCLCNEP